jgi:hypothetical protein
VAVWCHATVLSLGHKTLRVQVARAQTDGTASGVHDLSAHCIVLAAGAAGTPALLRTAAAASAWPMVGRHITQDIAAMVLGEWPQPFSQTADGGRVSADRASTTDPADPAWTLTAARPTPHDAANSIALMGPAAAAARAVARLLAVRAVAMGTVGASRMTWRRDGSPVWHPALDRAWRHRLVDAQHHALQAVFAAGALRAYAPSAGPEVLRRDAIGRLATRVHRERSLAGVAELHASGTYGGAIGGAHVSTSVTDGWGRVHGCPWLRVADASLAAASPGAHAHVALLAMADRVADGVRVDWAALSSGAAA